VERGRSGNGYSLLNASTVNSQGRVCLRPVSKNRNGPSVQPKQLRREPAKPERSLDITKPTIAAQPLIVCFLVRDPINLFWAYGRGVSGAIRPMWRLKDVFSQTVPKPECGDSFAVIRRQYPSTPNDVATVQKQLPCRAGGRETVHSSTSPPVRSLATTRYVTGFLNSNL